MIMIFFCIVLRLYFSSRAWLHQREEGLKILLNYVLKDTCGHLLEQSNLLSQGRTLQTASILWKIFSQDPDFRSQMMSIEGKIDAGRLRIINPVRCPRQSTVKPCCILPVSKANHAAMLLSASGLTILG